MGIAVLFVGAVDGGDAYRFTSYSGAPTHHLSSAMVSVIARLVYIKQLSVVSWRCLAVSV